VASLARIYTVVLREPRGCRLGGGGDAVELEALSELSLQGLFATLARSVTAGDGGW